MKTGRMMTMLVMMTMLNKDRFRAMGCCLSEGGNLTPGGLEESLA